jgi:hypothetical protein
VVTPSLNPQLLAKILDHDLPQNRLIRFTGI